MNMDYSLCQSLQNTNMKGIIFVIVLYDIMCQYFKKFFQRVRASDYLTIDPALKILPGIGLFHVHDHVKVCFARYAPTLLPRAGRVDGEIIETLWSVLNHAAPCMRRATLAHRAELLDDHMGDNNWKKLLNISAWLPDILPITGIVAVRSVCRKYRNAVEGAATSKQTFIEMNRSAGVADIAAWKLEAAEAEAAREGNPAAMDIYEARVPKSMGVRLPLPVGSYIRSAHAGRNQVATYRGGNIGNVARGDILACNWPEIGGGTVRVSIPFTESVADIVQDIPSYVHPPERKVHLHRRQARHCNTSRAAPLEN